MDIAIGALIAVINQSLLYWRMRQLENKNIIDPKQIVNLARISLIERLVLVGILLVFAMMQFDPLSIVVSFFLINLGVTFYKNVS